MARSQAVPLPSRPGATLGGTGTTGTITTLDGTVNPGDPVSQNGILNATAANFSSGTLTLEVTGYTTAGTSYDQLNLGTGTTDVLTLGGSSTLTLDLSGLSSTGTATSIIRFGSVTGTFTNVTTINNPNNYQPILTYNANSLDVTFVSGATHFGVTRRRPRRRARPSASQ